MDGWIVPFIWASQRRTEDEVTNIHNGETNRER